MEDISRSLGKRGQLVFLALRRGQPIAGEAMAGEEAGEARGQGMRAEARRGEVATGVFVFGHGVDPPHTQNWNRGLTGLALGLCVGGV